MLPFPPNVLAEEPIGSDGEIYYKHKIVCLFHNMGVWYAIVEDSSGEPYSDFFSNLRPFLTKGKRYKTIDLVTDENSFTIPEFILIRLVKQIFYPNVTF